MKKIITIGITKGGTGKSTLSANIAVLLARGEHKVRVLDLDHRNQSSKEFFDMRTDIECILVRDIDHLIESIDFEGYIIADIGGFDTELTRGIITASDALLIPFSPKSPKDIGGLVKFMDMLDEITSIDGVNIEPFLVPSMVHHLANRDKILEPIQPLLERGYKMGGIVTRRNSYEVSGDEGKDVYEFNDMRATNEIITIAQKII